MLPAGAGIVCVSPRALDLAKTAQLPRCYWSFEDTVKANATGYFPYTPSVPMLYGLRESLAMLFEEGLENVFARHNRLAEGCRRAVAAWGLTLCARAPKWHSDTVSAIMVPAGINGADVIDVAYRRYNFALGAGLSKVAGKLFRIGHLGDLNEITLLAGIGGAEMAMRDVGIKLELGSGVAAAQKYWLETQKPLPPKPAAGPAEAAVARKPAGVA
jgi:alanine-glyoxylate transaminase/serine-glyoxylate transaminase/serine-pyruvate transaminase